MFPLLTFSDFSFRFCNCPISIKFYKTKSIAKMTLQYNSKYEIDVYIHQSYYIKKYPNNNKEV